MLTLGRSGYAMPIWKIAATGLVLAVVSACSARDQSASGPVFGGRGATVAVTPSESPLPAAGAAQLRSAGACGEHAPASDATLLDDFEDGDAKPFKVFQREGWWFTAVDDSAGGSVHPPAGSFAPDRLPDPAPDNLFAAHLSAQGYTTWGVVWGTSLSWADRGVKCPFNASLFSGIRLRAKGPATVAVKFNMPETVPKAEGGLCTEGCYDAHQKILFLKEGWQTIEVPFDRLQQGGWGTDVRFDPSRLMSLGFAVDVKQQPADFWIDDIEFMRSPSGTSSGSGASVAPHSG